MSSVLSPASSTRSSLDRSHPSGATSSSTAPASAAARAEAREARRNRSALRDYYNLADSTSTSSSTTNITSARSAISQSDETAQPTLPSRQPSLLDPLEDQGFVASSYLDELLSRSSLTDVLRVQVALSQETRGLDGERKGLVYDNYGRLIGARNVVQRVGQYFLPLANERGTSSDITNGKESMELVKDSVEGLDPKVEALTSKSAQEDNAPDRLDGAAANRQRQQRDTVKWVLAAPFRMEELLRDGKQNEAQKLQAEAEGLLDEWQGVHGADAVRTRLGIAWRMTDLKTNRHI